MSQAISSRSRQLLYIAIAAFTFSLLSASYKYVTAEESKQKIAGKDCQEPENAVDLDELCVEFGSETQFSSLKP